MNTNTTFDVSATISAIADSVTGGMSETDAIRNSDYGIADRAEKARIRNAFKARFDSAMRDGKFDLAQFNWAIHAAFKNAGGSNSVVVSNNDELRTVIRGMVAVVNSFVNGVSAPNGLDSFDLSGEFDSAFEFTGEYDGEMVELTDELVTRFVPKKFTRNAPTNDVAELISNAMLNFDVDTFVRVSEIRKEIAKNNPDLNVDSAWDGRINARLFPNSDSGECTIPNVVGMKNHPFGNSTRNGAKRVSD